MIGNGEELLNFSDDTISDHQLAVEHLLSNIANKAMPKNEKTQVAYLKILAHLSEKINDFLVEMNPNIT